MQRSDLKIQIHIYASRKKNSRKIDITQHPDVSWCYHAVGDMNAHCHHQSKVPLLTRTRVDEWEFVVLVWLIYFMKEYNKGLGWVFKQQVYYIMSLFRWGSCMRYMEMKMPRAKLLCRRVIFWLSYIHNITTGLHSVDCVWNKWIIVISQIHVVCHFRIEDW